MARKSSTLEQLWFSYDSEYVARMRRISRPAAPFNHSPAHLKALETFVKSNRGIYRRCYRRGSAFERMLELHSREQ